VLVSPDGKNKRSLSQLNAASVAWSRDSQTLYGCGATTDAGRWLLLM
jgi:hypothetical protein